MTYDSNDYSQAYQNPNQPSRPKKRKVWPWFLAAALALIVFCGGLTAIVSSGADPDPAPIKPTAIPTTTAPTLSAKKVAPAPKTAVPVDKPAPATINGDDLVHIGEDAPAGTYRAAGPIEGDMCYWKKSKDAEGTDIIANDIPAGGRPQVTLKKGQWFTSQGCPQWVLKPSSPKNLTVASSLRTKKVYVISQNLSGWPVSSAANWLDRYTGSDWVNAKSCPRGAYRCIWVKKDNSLRAPVIAATYGYNTSRVVIRVDVAYANSKGITSQAKRKYVIAHELGHAGFLRAHVGSRSNLMYAHVGGYHYGLTGAQKTILRKH